MNSEKMIFIIGDKGVVLTHVKGGVIKNRLFVNNNEELPEAFTSYIKVHNNIPIYILIDNLEQTYSKQILPAVSSLYINKLVQKRLERDFNRDDIKGAFYIGRLKALRKDWIYIFVNSPINKKLKFWIEFLSDLDNPFAGIYFLPVELQPLITSLNKALAAKKIFEKPARWQVLVTNNKASGYRHIVFQDEKIIFSRLTRSINDNNIDIIAGNVEQDILNTVDYLRHLDLQDDEDLDVIILTEKDIIRSLGDVIIKDKKAIMKTPHEAAEYLNYQASINETDRFTDLLSVLSFASHRPKLKTFTSHTKKLEFFDRARKGIKTLSNIFVPLTIIAILFFIYQIIMIDNELKDIENKKTLKQQQWMNAQKIDNYDVDDANVITDSIELINKLSVYQADPMSLIKKLGYIQDNYATAYSINWTNKRTDKEQIVTPGESAANAYVSAIFNLKYYNMGDNLDKLFTNFDEFTVNLNRSFANYTVHYTKLPDKISYESLGRTIDFQLSISTQQKK